MSSFIRVWGEKQIEKDEKVEDDNTCSDDSFFCAVEHTGKSQPGI